MTGEMESPEACALLQERYGVPVLYLTNGSDEALLDEAERSRPQGYLVRPVTELQLRLSIEVAMRKQAEEQRDKFAFIADASNDLMTLISRDFIYEAANKAYLSTLPEGTELLGRSVKEVWGPENFEHIRPNLERCFNGETVRYESWISFHDRGKGYFDVCFYPYRSQAGRVSHAAVVSHDVTPHKLAKEALAVSERKLNSIVETTPDIIYRLDPQGRITFINSAITRYGYSVEEMLGRDVLEFIHPEEREYVARRIKERRTGKRSTRYLQVRLLTKKRSQVPMEVNYRDLEQEPVLLFNAEGLYRSTEPSAESFIGTQGLARDVTERKKWENRLKEALEEKEILLSEIHHRVKNNLQVISSLMDMAGRRIGDPLAREIFSDIQGKIHSLSIIHNRLYAEEQFTSVNIATFAKDLYAQISQMESWKGAAIKAEFDLQDVELTVNQAIPACLFLNEALTNVYRHAFAEGESGRVKIGVSRGEGGSVAIRVADNGRGMTPEVTADKPAGMGLKLMRSIAEFQLGGEFLIDGDSGTEVVLRFTPQD
jgi:PAS domain S-box-containing protein